MNLMLVYFLEYMCTTCFADITTRKLRTAFPDRKDEYLYANGFTIFSFCYQIGVFISRSSLAVIKINKVEVLTILQIINFLFWLFNSIFLFMTNFYGLFVLMIWVGLMGGGSYVNVMYQILENPGLGRNEKELALTLTTIFNDAGVLLASLMSLLLDNTAFKND